MENIFTAFCIMLQQGFNIPSQACNSAFTATYINSDFKKEFDASQRIVTRKGIQFANDHRAIVYTAILIGEGIDLHNRREFKAVMPLTPFVNQLSVNMNEREQEYRLEWQWNF